MARTQRADWRLADELFTEPIGLVMMAQVSYSPHRIRLEWMGADHQGLIAVRDFSTGRSYSLYERQITRWRPLPNPFFAGDFVVLAGEPAAAWRGYVRSTDGDDVVVETNRPGNDSIARLASDDLTLASRARPERRPVNPRVKPGPVAADPIAEQINQEAHVRDS